ncbi:MAG: hypothetical protein ABEJ83_01115 [Candidatus Nanohaloarchaea archaeon]
MVNAGRYIPEDKTEENGLEKAQELAKEWNHTKKDKTPVERQELKEQIFDALIQCRNRGERTEVFDFMDGSKKDLRQDFADYCKEKFQDLEDQESDPRQNYSNETVEKAEKLLEEEHILKKVKTVLDHRIAGEDVNKLGLFLQLLSKDTENPLMIFGIQKQGEGKSYLAKNVIDLFPDHQVERLTDATKSSIYRIAQDEGKDYFDDKIVFFGEIPENEDDRDVFQIFRQLNSEGEVQKRLTMGENGDMESKKLELEGSPAVISTTVNEGLIDEQDLSRGMAYSPEMSKEQNEKVREFQNTEKEFPEHVRNPEEIEELEKALECALDMLSREEVRLQNPFTRDLGNQVPEDSDNIKRDYPKTLQIASEMPAYLYHRQRPKKQLHGQEYSYVSWKDVARGVVINRKFINNMIRGRTESTMDAYKEIKERLENSERSYSQMRTRTNDPEIDVEAEYFTNKDLEKWMSLAGQTAREYTRKLDKMELIYKDSSSRPHRHYLLDSDVSETAGITLRSLHNILASVIDREELGEWARKYYEIMDIEGGEENIIEKVAFGEEDLPITLDIGLEKDDSLPTPLYQRFSEYKVEEATALKLEKDGSVIMYGPDSVIASFSDESDDDGEDEEGTEKESVYEKYDEAPQMQISKAFSELEAVGRDGLTAKVSEIEDETELESDDFDQVFERMESEGLISEPKAGKYNLKKKAAPGQVVNP